MQCNLFAFHKSSLGYNPMDIDSHVHTNIIYSVGRILVINDKIQIIRRLKPVFNFLSVFYRLSLIIKIFFTIIEGIDE